MIKQLREYLKIFQKTHLNNKKMMKKAYKILFRLINYSNKLIIIKKMKNLKISENGLIDTHMNQYI
jgi:hypothetical protein